MSKAAVQFRQARETEWRRLEALLATLEKKSPRALSDEDLMELPILYRSALSSLSVARETSLDLNLITYLEGLCARAYFFVYGVRTSARARLVQFFRDDWRNAVRSLWRETIVSLLLIAFGSLVGYMLVLKDPAWFASFVPSELASGRDFSASTASLRATLYDTGGSEWLEAFAAFLFTHNSQVAIMCFALGFAFGLPTTMLLVYNGLMLGAFVALFNSHGLGTELAGWLLIHGTTEIFAIALAGAAGIKMGWAVVFPGEETRLAAATSAGRTAATAMAGVVLMLLVAGLLEGVGRQTITSDVARYGIGLGMLTIWLAYYYVPRRSRRG
ncbi:MAG TPA: stage II sporulation protein M [Allosphingosinicella sp.]|nr:stage II sporulation protein M [Allosphingosinicella sp.]